MSKRPLSGMVRIIGALGLGLALASCAKPPVTAYESTQAAAPAAAEPVGMNSAGEACTMQRNGTQADIYCGGLDQPSAEIQSGGAASQADLATLAATSAWRAGLEANNTCAAPTAATILDGQPAEILACTQRLGGWPYAALVSVIGGQVYYADGVLPSLPAMQRGIGVVSGRIPAGAGAQVAVNEQLLVQNLAAAAFSSGDIGQYDALMQAGANANQAEDFPAAIIAYRAALALQQKALGPQNPGTVAPLLELALNLSDQAEYPEAESLFAKAATLAPLASDQTAAPRLLYYLGLDQLNQGQPARALVYLRQAEAGYAAQLPPDVLQAAPVSNNEALFAISNNGAGSGLLASQATLNSPLAQTALLGVIETWRYEAIALNETGDKAGSAAALAQARQIAAANDIAPPTLDARLDRTSASMAFAAGQGKAANTDLTDAAQNFAADLPGSRPVAETALLQAAVLHSNKDDKDALAACRTGISLLENLQSGATPEQIDTCLSVFNAIAQSEPDNAEALHAEMFAAAELAQGSVTAREIAQDAARLSNSSRDPKAAAAIRAQQDAQAHLASLYQQRDAGAQANPPASAAQLAALDKQIAAASAALKQASLAEQAASPNFGQLVQQVVPARAVLAALRPDEAYLGITLTPAHAWLFFLNNGTVSVASTDTGLAPMTAAVSAVRASIEPAQGRLPAFDMKDAAAIYGATLAPFSGEMANLHELVVAPSGPLLALPFALLPTGPASPDDLGNAPWLVRKVTLAYVPAAANFVSLRKIEGSSAAQKPWFGFGDFRPVTLAQAQAAFPPAACPESAPSLVALPHLPGALLELRAASAIFNAGPQDELLGTAFTKANVEAANLADYRILHFATHALLPTDLPCQTEPAIVTSAPPDAASASAALLGASDVTNLHLDANLVLLSACNTGGGAAGGEALSGLARSFFYAGARAMLVTQWSVNDQVSAYLVAETLTNLNSGGGGAASSLRTAQLGLITGAGHGLPANLANPFFWAAFAVIGDGGAAGNVQVSSLSNRVNSGS